MASPYPTRKTKTKRANARRSTPKKPKAKRPAKIKARPREPLEVRPAEFGKKLKARAIEFRKRGKEILAYIWH